MTGHQEKQIEVINRLEEQVKTDTVASTLLPPIADFYDDPRVALTGVHFLKLELLMAIEQINSSLKKIEPLCFFYPHTSLHMTIKNVKTASNPPQFTHEEISKAANVFSQVVPNHRAFRAYFYRLMLLKNSLVLMGTTDSSYDNLVLVLDRELQTAGVPDNKKYINAQYFFANITLARFSHVSEEFVQEVTKISNSLVIPPYAVDSVTLVAGNAVSANRVTVGMWNLH